MERNRCLNSFSWLNYKHVIGILLALFVFIPGTIKSQTFFTAEASYAVKLGRTKPLYDLVSVSPTDTMKLKIRKSNKPKFVPNFAGRRHLDFHLPSALPQGADPLFNPIQSRTPLNKILPIASFQGISENDAFAGVPDVNGDMGREYYVEIVNATHFKVYSKTGQPLSNLISANTIWSQVQQSSAGDPIILYDQEADRWFLTEFPSNNRVLLAISVTNDPRGAWDAYAFQTPRFPDFPKYSIWHNAYFLTTNEGGSNFPIYAFNRQDMLLGLAQIRFQRLTVPKHGGVFFEVGQPVDWDGMTPPPPGSPGLVVKLNDDDWLTTDQDHIALHKINIDWDNASLSNVEVVEIPTAPFDTDGCSMESTGGFSCVPQPNGQGIDGAEWIITNKAQYRNFGTHESFVMSFMVDVTGEEVAGIRWIEMRKTSSQDWHIYQEGTVGSEDGLHRFMSSIGIDGQGNIGLAYSISGAQKHPSLRYTGRYATDPLGIMTFEEYEFAKGNGSMNTDRYGDYASMSVDPADDKTFWFAGQYVPTNGNWSTWVVAFAAAKDTIDIFPVALIDPQNRPDLSTNEPLTIKILNRGLNTVYDFKVGYQFQNGLWIEENPLIDSLQIDSFYTHTFQTGMDFGEPGNYNVRIVTSLATDRNPTNDTLSFTVRKPAFKDLSLSFEASGVPLTVCSHTGNNSVVLRNMGAETIHTMELQVILNHTIFDTVTWSGALAPFEEEVFTFETGGLVLGDNNLAANIIGLNDGADEIPDNNMLEWIVNANPAGEALFLHLTTDNYPGETSWALIDSTEEVIMTGGPYDEQKHLYTTAFCLDKEACYTFIIYDAYGDGMFSQGVRGDFEIVNNNGDIIASLSRPNFGNSETSEFCLTEKCMLNLQVGVAHASGEGMNDGWVIGEVANAVGDFSYSINGGLSFQPGNTFLNLAPGQYELIAKDGAGCTDTVSFFIRACDIETVIITKPASGGDVGEIHISASGGIGALTFSINGQAFQPDTIFTMLEPGEYIVHTRDSAGCERVDTVVVSTSVGTTVLRDEHFIKLYPNPGKGLYQVTSVLNTNEVFINYTVFNASGEVVYHGALAKYNDKHKGEISILAFPAGIYNVIFYIGKSIMVKRLIKIG